MRRARFVASVLVALLLVPVIAHGAEPMRLEGTIPLGAVRGRIDHLAIDLGRHRLFVAELGNDSLGVVDLVARRIAKRVPNLKEPQGVAYAPAADRVYVANGGDGAVDILKGSDLSLVGRTDFGDDADNIRLDTHARQVFVGYGVGALAVLDTASGRKLADIPLAAHPESFQLGARGERIYVNLPDARHIAVINRSTRRVVAQWALPAAAGNYAMAFDEDGDRVVVAYRSPPMLAVFDSDRGTVVARLPTCGDADDVFVDRKRSRIYLACGSGALAIIQRDRDSYREVARIPTRKGARTALFVPELDRLFLAVRATAREPAAIWIFRPAS